ncbi:peptidoglycan-binding protein [Streptomyces alfalfae]|uniref:peptidoglycan-binding protein n=1 Tax=Streptomyces alfalfae TaxID=1642299 RepID=UPI001E452142|nr:efflux RND transporter periplasmic adaptor subunit [Streptomyces alfalfae]
MTTDGTDAPAVAGERSGALERHTSGQVATKAATDLDKAAEAPEVAETAEESPVRTLDTAAGEDQDPEPAGSSRVRRPLRTSLIVLAATAVVAAAGITATGALGGDGEGAAGAAPSAPPATAEVDRTTLTDSETVDGNLGYGDAATVQAPASSSGTGSDTDSGQAGQNGQGSASGGDGIVTWLPEEGEVIKRGDTVYRVDEQRVPLLYGSFPLYRTLQPGTEGADVRMLEKNLRALGHSGFTVDDTYDAATAAAVRDWQDDLNREETGAVETGDALVAPAARRVADVKTSPGAALSGGLLSWTGTERIVGVDLDVQFEDLVEKGTEARVTLPDDTTVRAEVTDVGTPSTSRGDESASGSGDSGSDSGGSGDDDPTLPLELTVKDQKGLGRYQAAAVDVTLKAESRKDVLVVPVNALVARKGGGYAVEVVTADGTEFRPVKTGMFADSRVEISGKGIKEGTVVGVPK